MSLLQRVLLLSALSTLPLTSHAMFAGFYASHGTGLHEVEFSSANSAYDFHIDLDSSTFNVHLGFFLNNNNRFIVSLDTIHFHEEHGAGIFVGGMKFDWQFLYGEKNIQPYWGVGFGIYNSDEIYRGNSLTSLSVQLMAGAKFIANETIEFDLSVLSQAFAWDEIGYFISSQYHGKAEQYTSHFTLGFGMDFKF